MTEINVVCKGQIRLTRDTVAPVEILYLAHTDRDDAVRNIWYVKDVLTGERFHLRGDLLGKLVNEMELIARIASDPARGSKGSG